MVLFSISDDDNHIVLQPITGRPDCQRDCISMPLISMYVHPRLVKCMFFIEIFAFTRDMIRNVLNLLPVKVRYNKHDSVVHTIIVISLRMFMHH